MCDFYGCQRWSGSGPGGPTMGGAAAWAGRPRSTVAMQCNRALRAEQLPVAPWRVRRGRHTPRGKSTHRICMSTCRGHNEDTERKLAAALSSCRGAIWAQKGGRSSTPRCRTARTRRCTGTGPSRHQAPELLPRAAARSRCSWRRRRRRSVG